MIIAVDFDGTLCEDRFPDIGKPNRQLIDQLKICQAHGDALVLWTCRNEQQIEEAVKWCAEQGLIFDYVNENHPGIVKKYGNDSRKIYADRYVDDKNGSQTDISSRATSIKLEYLEFKVKQTCLNVQYLKEAYDENQS